MANLSVETHVLSELPPGTKSAEWLDLSEQLGDEYKPERSRIIQALTKRGETIFYAVNQIKEGDLFFLSISLPEGVTAPENDQSTLLPEITAALNALIKQQP